MMRRRGVGIVGVAAVAHHASNKGAEQQAAADQNAAAAQAPAEAAPAAVAVPVAAVSAQPTAPAVDPTMAELQNLANLHTQGILTDEEFTASKAKLLGI